eukprot:166016_1
MGNKYNCMHSALQIEQPTVNISSSKTNDAFIINHHRNNTVNDPSSSLDALSHKRVIFISLIGLYQSYKKCPAHILYSSLLIMPLKKDWVHSPSKYMDQLHAASSGLILQDSESQELLELIKWKDSQGLVIWAQDEYRTPHPSYSDLVHPFWRFVSDKLVSLYDPITSHCCKPLILDVDDVSYKSTKIKMRDILIELYFKPLSYECVKTVLNASNPDSFHVVTSYNEVRKPPIEFVQMQMMDCDPDAQSNDEWWVSPDYL